MAKERQHLRDHGLALRRGALRIAFLGIACSASVAALTTLLGAATMPALPGSGKPSGTTGLGAPPSAASTRVGAAGYEIACLILAGSPGAQPREIERLAAGSDIPVVWVASGKDATKALRDAAPDVAVAACFPWRLPRAARAIPRLGILNIHPSLLPLGRGPQPVFWTLRRGEPRTGVTLHVMDAGLDTGPIVAQAKMAIPPGIRAPELEDALMARGAELLVEALPAFATGDVPARPQPASGATAAPFPAPADWAMLASLPAAWAWRFARGVAPLGGPLTVIAGGQIIPVSDALDWSADERLAQAVEEANDGAVRIRFTPGWVRFRRAAG